MDFFFQFQVGQHLITIPIKIFMGFKFLSTGGHHRHAMWYFNGEPLHTRFKGRTEISHVS